MIGSVLKKSPVLWRCAEHFRAHFPGSGEYWEKRYSGGGNSGSGSYGRLATYKAQVLNELVARHAISSVIEFGCGDGNQLELASYPRYIGLDVSRTAIARTAAKFKGDETKSFFLYDPECFHDESKVLNCDLALSFDVIYHLTEDDIFKRYMRHLFGTAKSYVIIYSSDYSEAINNSHVRHRRFSEFVNEQFDDWALLVKHENPYSLDKIGREGTFAQFYVYEHR